MLREIGSVFSFLTIIPSPGGTLQGVAGRMYLFPAAGLAIGLLVGSAGLGLSLFLDPLLVGLLVASILAILTGIHHADGLADFADGLAAGGGRDKKLGAMKDLSTGSAGTVGTVLYVVGLVAAISLLAGGGVFGGDGGSSNHDYGLDLLRAILVSEILAKFSMVLLAAAGSAAAPGSSSPFVEAMRSRKRVAAAFVIMLVPVILVGGAAAGLLALGAVMALTVSVLAVSARSFGGITGDVLGATNELARLASLMVYVTI